MGIYRFTPLLAIHGNIGWIASQYRRWIKMFLKLIIVDAETTGVVI